MTSKELNERLIQGWNTWYGESVTTHVLLPYGFSIHIRFRSPKGGILHNQLINRDPSVKADIRSWDGSYTCLYICHEDRRFRLESSVQPEGQLILVTPENEDSTAEQVVVETGFLWGRDGTLVRKNGILQGICPDGTTITIHTDAVVSDAYAPMLATHTLLLSLTKPALISTFPCSTDEAGSRIKAARDAVLAEAGKAGNHAETYLAIQSCLAWNNLYDPCKNRVCAPVSRNWNVGHGSTLFCWDTFFAGLMYSLGCKELAYQNVYAILSEVTKDGLIPNYCRGPYKSYDRSQPPVGSMVVEKLWNLYGDREFLEEVYPTLFRWNGWFAENRMTEEGYLCWGSHVSASGEGVGAGINATQELQGAKYESGLDNSPMYDDVTFDDESGLILLADVGLSGMFIKDCRCLITLAEVLGYPDDVAVLRARLEKAESAMLKLWNPETGIFENLDLVTGQFSHRISPTNLYSLYALSVTEKQKKSMMEKYLFCPDEMGEPYMLPSISRSDSAYAEQNYWRGRVWGPMNAIVYEALRDAGLDGEACALAANSEKLFLLEWREHRHVHENYNGTDGMGCNSPHSDPFYHWGGLLGYIAIDADVLRNEK